MDLKQPEPELGPWQYRPLSTSPAEVNGSAFIGQPERRWTVCACRTTASLLCVSLDDGASSFGAVVAESVYELARLALPGPDVVLANEIYDPRSSMNASAITFDFHNTLAECPEWFELEVRSLPSAFLAWHGAESSTSYSDSLRSEADDRYRLLRREIMDHGNELTAEQSLRVIFDAMHVPMDDTGIDTGVAELMRIAAGKAKPIPGAVETVQAIAEAGIPLGVVSSAVYHPFLEWTLSAFGIRDDFVTIVTSASAGFYKSRPEIYLHAAELLAAQPERVVHVGDSLRYDVGGASRAGMGTVWLQFPGKPGDGSQFTPDLTVTTLQGSAPGILGVLSARLQAQRA